MKNFHKDSHRKLLNILVILEHKILCLKNPYEDDIFLYQEYLLLLNKTTRLLYNSIYRSNEENNFIPPNNMEEIKELHENLNEIEINFKN
jgi:hypothetical protein